MAAAEQVRTAPGCYHRLNARRRLPCSTWCGTQGCGALDGRRDAPVLVKRGKRHRDRARVARTVQQQWAAGCDCEGGRALHAAAPHRSGRSAPPASARKGPPPIVVPPGPPPICFAPRCVAGSLRREISVDTYQYLLMLRRREWPPLCLVDHETLAEHTIIRSTRVHSSVRDLEQRGSMLKERWRELNSTEESRRAAMQAKVLFGTASWCLLMCVFERLRRCSWSSRTRRYALVTASCRCRPTAEPKVRAENRVQACTSAPVCMGAAAVVVASAGGRSARNPEGTALCS